MEDLTYHLEGIIKNKDEIQDFEGPLNLILMLLSKNKIEIRDLVISDILDQYLAYLDQMEKMDLDIASEFVQMASYLLYIKAKTLLNSEKEVSELELLMQSLEQIKAKDVYSSIKEVIPFFQENYAKGSLYFTKQQEAVKVKNVPYEYHHEKVELLKSLFDIYTRSGKTISIESIAAAAPQFTPYGVKEKSRELIDQLKASKKLSVKSIYRKCSSKSEVVATFISILELCSMGSLTVDKEDDGNEYYISFVGGDIDKILDRIVE